MNAILLTEVVEEHRTIARLKSRNIDNSPSLSYRAGKPFAVDKFNAAQRISSGALPKDIITARVAAGTLTIMEVDPRAQWNQQQKHFDSRVAILQVPDRSRTP